jgi:hypothetical protein
MARDSHMRERIFFTHGRMLLILVSVHNCFSCLSLSPPINSKISCRFTMGRDGAYKILPAPVVSSNYTLLLRFTTGTLNVRHCFCWDDVCRFQVHVSLPFAKFAPRTRTSSNHL